MKIPVVVHFLCLWCCLAAALIATCQPPEIYWTPSLKDLGPNLVAEVKLGTLARDGLTMKADAATNEKFWQVRSHDVGHGEDGLVRRH